jgi:DNA-binding NarL/FixJ family response regulator
VLVASLEQVAAGELCFEKALSDQFLMSRRKAVTNQEGRIIALLAQGKRNKEIAFDLHITEGTIKVYLSRLPRSRSRPLVQRWSSGGKSLRIPAL